MSIWLTILTFEFEFKLRKQNASTSTGKQAKEANR